MSVQKGSALLVVLMILALMAALATDMTISFQTQLQRSRRINDSLQAKYALLYAEAQAAASLQSAAEVSPSTSQETLTESEEVDENTKVSWKTEDRQNCFNLNSLKDMPIGILEDVPYKIGVFEALLEKRGVEKYRVEEIGQSIADYIDNDTSPRIKGAEDDYYQHRPKKYLTAGQNIFLPAEIRDVKGMTEDIYQKLSPFICATFSNELAININTLTEQQASLLAALFLNNISELDAAALIRKRPDNGWKTVDAFLYQAQRDFTATKPLVDSLKKQLTTRSSYFLITSTVHQGELTLGMRTFLLYDEKNKTTKIYLRQLTDGSSED
ncbi:T2SS protein K [Klebsiella sp. RIT-PI-d]|uniref:type II secretion system minor pseudopilin GspK n=1 Tax=Klebsiella sp. RIT-PI-d TaxID=1681196 RepID=UPI0006762F41|nr:type II secretion system minor pseudopilin GspK [Klebsiella sp. RIT-PI-d]KNC10548.1 T2SS protein K [Klebsiella sp. RIT-PI-d]